MDHAGRIAALARALENPLFVSKPANLRYLTGFTGSNGFLLVEPDGTSTFVTDGRYGEAAEPLVAAVGGDLVVYTGPLRPVLERVLGRFGSVGVEAHHVTLQFADQIGTATVVTPTTGTVERLRRTKDADEITALKAAARAGDVAFSRLDELIDGVSSEAELGWAIQDAMRAAGGDVAGWDPIVAMNAGASIPHYRSGEQPITDGVLLLDYGCVVDGYHSDMSRTVWLGDDEPDPQMHEIHAVVAEAQRAAIEAVAPGVSTNDVDGAARRVLAKHGYEEQFVHSIGHGVGLEIHEDPFTRRETPVELEVDDVITVEPGVYIPGRGGVRIEDMIHVTDAGPVVLTHAPREMQPR